MATKKLQNNFTTREQSKRLFELGMPEWTADAYRFYNGRTTVVRTNPFECRKDFFSKTKKDGYSPCWSASRLIEIYELCSGQVFRRDPFYFVIDDILQRVNCAIIKITEQWDFSKLED